MYLGNLNKVNAGTPILIRYTITPQGNLESVNRNAADLWSDSAMPLISSGVSVAAGALALGAVDGGIWIMGADTDPQAMHRLRLTSIRSAADSGTSLALITEDRNMSIIPLDYQALKDSDTITLEDSRGNTRISGDSGVASGSPGRFLLWQSGSTRSFPVLISGANTTARRNTALEKAPLRYPLRAVSLLGDQALFLDTAGTITLVSTDSGGSIFTSTAADPLDISFYDNQHIIIGQAAAAQRAPFLLVNTVTQETAPIIYPAAAGAKLYRAPDGRVYSGVVHGSPDSAVTVLLLLNIERPSASTRLLEYPGEDTTFIIAKSGQSVASTIGGNGPTLQSSSGFIPFERSPSLPENLIGSDQYFIVLGKDGSVSWHNPDNGSLLARLRLLEKEWILDTKDRNLRGAINK
jgi:hypothetical protein